MGSAMLFGAGGLLAAVMASASSGNDSAYCTGNASNVVSIEKIFRSSEVAAHKTKDTGIWVTYGDGVYDITAFVSNHPGGIDKIMLAAGGSVEPFWRIYRQHYNSKLPLELLAPMKIGRLHPDDIVTVDPKDESDPYKDDPELSPVLIYHQKKPTNAEPPAALLGDSWITPNDLWFVRNHHPVPVIDASKHTLTLHSPVSGKDISFSVEDLKSKFSAVKVISSLQCGGNRRREMSDLEKTLGSPWEVGAIATAEWTGVRLRDLLNRVGFSEDDENSAIEHVQFHAADDMAASIPITKASSRHGDVIVAYAMNGVPIPPEHGFPLRVIVPGHVGVRNVKWVDRITLSAEEAPGPWQRGIAYKGFGPSQRKLDGLDVEKIPSLQEQPVQSSFTLPKHGAALEPGPQVVKGFAYSGGGRGIVRVDISADGGKSWKSASLTEGSTQPLDRAWAWTLWECEVDIPESAVNSKLELICKATDAAYNVQPDSIAGIWNLRGINNNAWHRVVVNVVPEEVTE